MSKPFEQPPTYLGQIVRWKPHPGSPEGCPGMVVQLGVHNIHLIVFHPNRAGGMTYDGVLHESDPRWDPVRFVDVGVWAYVDDQDDYLQYVLSRPEPTA